MHPKIIDLTLDRVWRLLARFGQPAKQVAAGDPHCRNQWQRLDPGDDPRRAGGGRAVGSCLYLASSGTVPRTHPSGRRADLGTRADRAVLDECYAANGGENITYFEITTCAALLAFARAKADYTLLEVGLGGRLDATNVIHEPAVTVITPVSIDHEQFLGNTLGKIAAEKAGNHQTRCALYRRPATGRSARGHRIHRRAPWRATVWSTASTGMCTKKTDVSFYQDETGLRDLPLPNLLGAHQIQNAGAALAVLRHLNMGDDAYEAAVTKAEWPARMQRLKTGPLVEAAPQAELWLDGGHNAAAGEALAEVFGETAGTPDAYDLRHAQHQGCDRVSGPTGQTCTKPNRRFHSR